MRIATVCEKWQLPLLEGEIVKLPAGDKGYYEYINERPKETGKNALCVEDLLRRLPVGLTVAEHFGGVGVFATVIEGVLKPQSHFIGDIEDNCLKQLTQAFSKTAGVHVELSDARESLGRIKADIYVLDFPFMTIKRYPEWEEQITAMFKKEPRAVLWMDGAGRYLHFHKERYGEIFGGDVDDIEDYTYGVSMYVHERHGYSITACSYQHACSYFLFEKTKPGKIVFKKFTDGEKGLTIS